MGDVFGGIVGTVESLFGSTVEAEASALAALVAEIERDVAAAVQSIESQAASEGMVIGAPSEDPAGVYAAWEVHRRYWNGGAAVHFAHLAAASSALRRT